MKTYLVRYQDVGGGDIFSTSISGHDREDVEEKFYSGEEGWRIVSVTVSPTAKDKKR